VIVINADGIPIRTTLDHDTSVQARAGGDAAPCLRAFSVLSAAEAWPFLRSQYAAMVSQLTFKARAVLKELPLPGSATDSAAVRQAGARPLLARSLGAERATGAPPAHAAPRDHGSARPRLHAHRGAGWRFGERKERMTMACFKTLFTMERGREPASPPDAERN